MKKKDIFENFILAAIILVIFQIFLEEYSRYFHLRLSLRNFLFFTNILFDLIFSTEFILRSIWAFREKKTKEYIIYKRGWVDFISSLPLLLLDIYVLTRLYSTGNLAEAGSSIAVLNVLKVVKAIRVTRILRLIRILKIFGKIHNAESKMAQRHTQTISTIGVFSIILLLITLSFFKLNKFDNLIKNREEHYSGIIRGIENVRKTVKVPIKQIAPEILSSDRNILKFYYSKFLLFSNIDNIKSKKYYGPEDYIKIVQNEYIKYVSFIDLNKLVAGINLQNIFIIVCLILCYMVIYTKHFVQTVSDVIHVLKRGYKEKDYNLQVKIREPYKDDEIYQLAEDYNDNFLPKKIKMQKEEKEKKSSVISMDDLMDFGKK